MKLLRVIFPSLFVASVAEDTCSPNAKVGHCFFADCSGHGGPAHCDGFDCFCDSGYCSSDQMTCVPVTTTTTTTTTPTTTTSTRATTTNPVCRPGAVVGQCSIIGCLYMTHGWAHCRDGQCLCDAGHCSTDGVTCVAEDGEETFSSESLVQDEGAPICL